MHFAAAIIVPLPLQTSADRCRHQPIHSQDAQMPALGPLVSGLVLFLLATVSGAGMMRKVVQVHEARHELKRGSAGFIRTIAGWSFVGFWGLAVWFCATVIGDWGTSGDLDGAMARSLLRLEILLHIAAALSEADS